MNTPKWLVELLHEHARAGLIQYDCRCGIDARGMTPHHIHAAEVVWKEIERRVEPILLKEYEIAPDDVLYAIAKTGSSIFQRRALTAEAELRKREHVPSLLPAESLALTVALAQIQRNEPPEPNGAVVCVYALARLTGRYDWTAGAADE